MATRAEMATFFKKSERRIDQITAEGHFEKEGPGQWNLTKSARTYIDHLEKRLAGTGNSAAIGDARQRLLSAKARAAETEADLQARAAFLRADVEAAWFSIVDNVRTRLLAVPASAGPLIHAAASQAEANAILTAHIHGALEDLANTPIYDRSTAPAETADEREDDAA